MIMNSAFFFIHISLLVCLADSIGPQQGSSYNDGYVHAHGHIQASRVRHHIRESRVRDNVPTLMFDYRPREQLHPNSNQHYMEKYQNGGNLNEIENENTGKIQTTGVFRTYGKGIALVPRRGGGDIVEVPRTLGSYKAYHGKVATRILNPDEVYYNINGRGRRDCSTCPKSEVVMATKGNNFVLLPDFCTHRQSHIAGPLPKSRLSEGVHLIVRRLKHSGQICRYTYTVKVRRCPSIESEVVMMKCSSDNAWGSQCEFQCSRERDLNGPDKIYCTDDLVWSGRIPECLENKRCRVPHIEKGSKLSCKSNDLANNNDAETLPEGSVCKIKTSHKNSRMKCKHGQWLVIQHNGKKFTGDKKRSYRYIASGGCPGNPCLNGGVCEKKNNSANETICKCPDSSTGPNCEFIKCDVNYCLNDGRCLHYNQFIACFCGPEYYGEKCQYHRYQRD